MSRHRLKACVASDSTQRGAMFHAHAPGSRYGRRVGDKCTCSCGQTRSQRAGDGKLVRALLSYALALFFWYKLRALARSAIFMST